MEPLKPAEKTTLEDCSAKNPHDDLIFKNMLEEPSAFPPFQDCQEQLFAFLGVDIEEPLENKEQKDNSFSASSAMAYDLSQIKTAKKLLQNHPK